MPRYVSKINIEIANQALSALQREEQKKITNALKDNLLKQKAEKEKSEANYRKQASIEKSIAKGEPYWKQFDEEVQKAIKEAGRAYDQYGTALQSFFDLLVIFMQATRKSSSLSRNLVEIKDWVGEALYLSLLKEKTWDAAKKKLASPPEISLEMYLDKDNKLVLEATASGKPVDETAHELLSSLAVGLLRHNNFDIAQGADGAITVQQGASSITTEAFFNNKRPIIAEATEQAFGIRCR